MEKQESRQNGDSLDETPEERDARREREADIAKYRAEKELVDAQRRLEKQRERTAKAERRAKRGPLLPRKVKLGLLAAVAAVVAIAVVVGVSTAKEKPNKTEYLTSSDLVGIVNVSKLETATYRYTGIAEKHNDKGDVDYRVYYESTVDAGYDLSKVTFNVDDDARTVTPVLPELQLDEPTIDTASFDYMPKQPDANPKDVIAICEADVLAEIDQAQGIRYTAEQNMKRMMEVLLMPILDARGYAIDWEGNPPEDVVDPSDADDGAQQETSEQEASSDE